MQRKGASVELMVKRVVMKKGVSYLNLSLDEKERDRSDRLQYHLGYGIYVVVLAGHHLALYESCEYLLG